MKRAHHRLRRFAAILIGIVFLVSGLLKIADPVGTMLIVTEYFKFFHLGFLLPIAKGTGIVLALAETLTGIALITGVLRETAAVATWILLGFFTLVTLILWIFNPVMDCGCFGEAIHLSHAQSFWKNVILLVLACIAFLPMKDFGEPKPLKRVAAALSALSVLVAVIYSNTHLPLADFTAFDWGAELFASLDDDVEADNHYKAAFIYEKDGRQGSFFLENLPDSSWTFVKVDTVFQEGPVPGKEHPILGFRDAEGEYQDHLAAEGKVVVLSVYDPAKAPWERIGKHYRAAVEAGARPLLLVASSTEEVDSFGIPIDLTVYYADYKTLITLNRSNGGGSYFCEGELIDKWASRDFPKDLAGELAADPVDLSTNRIIKRRIQAQGFGLYLAAILMLL